MYRPCCTASRLGYIIERSIHKVKHNISISEHIRGIPKLIECKLGSLRYCTVWIFRAAPQNIEQLLQLNEIFHTYLEFFAKGARKRRDCKRSVKISTRSGDSVVFLAQIAGKIKPSTTASRERRKIFTTP